MKDNDVAQFRLKPLHVAVATALVGAGMAAMPAVGTETTFTAERIIVAASCNPCAANKCNPCAAKCNPCAAKKCNPCAAKCNPCAAKKCNPCAAKCNPCAAKCNPCAAKCNPCTAKCNPCAAKCNPCAAKKCNPCVANACNPCNPCGAGKINPCAIKRNPCSPKAYAGNPCALIAEGKKLWADPKFSTNGLACATCHVGGQAAFNPTFAQPYPHNVGMPAQMAGLDQVTAEEMVQFCLVAPMQAPTLSWDSKELAALTA